MEEKKLKINIPKGYEIDKENSTFEEMYLSLLKRLKNGIIVAMNL